MKKGDKGCKRHAKEADKQQQVEESAGSRKQCAPQEQQEEDDLVAREFKKLQEQGLGFAKPIA